MPNHFPSTIDLRVSFSCKCNSSRGTTSYLHWNYGVNRNVLYLTKTISESDDRKRSVILFLNTNWEWNSFQKCRIPLMVSKFHGWNFHSVDKPTNSVWLSNSSLYWCFSGLTWNIFIYHWSTLLRKLFTNRTMNYGRDSNSVLALVYSSPRGVPATNLFTGWHGVLLRKWSGYGEGTPMQLLLQSQSKSITFSNVCLMDSEVARPSLHLWGQHNRWRRIGLGHSSPPLPRAPYVQGANVFVYTLIWPYFH